MADLATLKTRLTEAEDARHALATGKRVVEVERDGRKVKYHSGNTGDLGTYIDRLTATIDQMENPATSALPRRRFIGIGFR